MTIINYNFSALSVSQLIEVNQNAVAARVKKESAEIGWVKTVFDKDGYVLTSPNFTKAVISFYSSELLDMFLLFIPETFLAGVWN